MFQAARLILLLAVAGLAAGCTNQPPAAAPSQEPPRDRFTVVITGRLLDKDHTPLPEVSVMLCEASANPQNTTVSCTLRTGPDGKLANPGAMTDAQGRFRIIADRRFWEKTGAFTLHVGILPDGMIQGGMIPTLMRVNEGTGALDAGDIVVLPPKE